MRTLVFCLSLPRCLPPSFSLQSPMLLAWQLEFCPGTRLPSFYFRVRDALVCYLSPTLTSLLAAIILINISPPLVGDEKRVATLSRGHSRGSLVSGRLVPGFVSRGRSVEGERSRENNRERERERVYRRILRRFSCGFCVCRVIGYYRLFLLGYIPCRSSPRRIESSSLFPPPFVSSFRGASERRKGA